MRKLRDIDAELRATVERTRQLKTLRLTQLGDLVIATGADALAFEVLAGALLAAVAQQDEEIVKAWERQGQAFFRETRRRGPADGAEAGVPKPHAGGGQGPANRGLTGAPGV